MNSTIRIGIIRDGGTDFTILKKFVSIILEKHHGLALTDDNFYEFDKSSLNITNALNEYIAKAHLEKHSLFGEHALHFRSRIEQVLELAIQIFLKENNTPFTNRDILVLNGDAEKILGNKVEYFKDWAYTIYSVLWLAIEKFYNKRADMSDTHENLPLILPIILFPSSEILLASCMYDVNKKNYRNFKAKPDLKMLVYEKEDTNLLTREELSEILELCMSPENLNDIYKDVPEARKFIQILAFAPH